jgi:hypothetical protein
VVMFRVRVAFWELVVEAINAISNLIRIIQTLYTHRSAFRKFGETLRKATFPVLIASLIVIVQWIRTQVNDSTLWNFPPGARSPFPHVSLYAAPLLEILSYSWIGSLGFSIIYSGRNDLGRFSRIGKPSGRFMKVTLVFYPALVLWFSSYSELSFLVPSSVQGVLYFASAVPLTFIVFRSIESVINRRILGKQGILSGVVDKALAFASIGMRSIGEWSYGNYRYVYSRFTGKPLEVVPRPNVRPTIAALLVSLSLITMTAAYELGYTSMLEMFYAFGVAPYALVIASGIIGWRKRKRENEEKKRVVRVPKRLRSKFQFFVSTISIGFTRLRRLTTE